MQFIVTDEQCKLKCITSHIPFIIFHLKMFVKWDMLYLCIIFSCIFFPGNYVVTPMYAHDIMDINYYFSQATWQFSDVNYYFSQATCQFSDVIIGRAQFEIIV